nr:recombinase family protein [Azospirillum sp. OGB3]
MSPVSAENWVYGYARVSTDDQNLALQRDALLKAGVPAERIYTDQMSGATVKRPGLTALRKALRPGDSLYVWRLDRLGRSVSELDALAKELREDGVVLKSLTEVFDTSSAFGTFMFQILSVFAEFERNLIRERTMAGLVAAKARGSKAGPKPKMSAEQVEEAQALLLDGKMTATEIAKRYGVSKPTLFRYIPGGREALALIAQQ